jgi:hypothetical protein
MRRAQEDLSTLFNFGKACAVESIVQTVVWLPVALLCSNQGYLFTSQGQLTGTMARHRQNAPASGKTLNPTNSTAQTANAA